MVINELIEFLSKYQNVDKYLTTLQNDCELERLADREYFFGEKGVTKFTETVSQIKLILPEIEKILSGEDDWKSFEKDLESCFSKYKEEQDAESVLVIAFYIYALCKECVRFASGAERNTLHQGEAYFKGLISGLPKDHKVSMLWGRYIRQYSVDFDNIVSRKTIWEAVDKALERRFSNVENRLESFESSVSKFEKRVDEGRKTENFVSLTKGFEQLRGKVATRLRILGSISWGLRTFIISLAGYFAYDKLHQDITIDDMPTLIAPAAFIAIMLYFLKLELREKQDEQEKMNQIDNKIAIIAFIEDYVKFYGGKNGGNSEDAMKSFNELIFSPIAGSKKDKIPEYTDDAQQVINIVRGKMSKKGE
ncbi:hypothetical protein [Salinicola endophyticus]|uniref:Uncharacterized protein n=1 Tax=Salinicola endophyticus TaxID=1949083 RepID=A0AB74U9T3_9GAMM